ncbi:MAG: hypothetical protein K6A41_04180 [Bacteroidales bacterium]|nr:hypothetical protein [Bacteroidales bacterium]
MNDLKRSCYSGSMPGIKSISFCHVSEVESITVVGVDSVTVTLKSSGNWGVINGKRMTASAGHQGKNWSQKVNATLPGWTMTEVTGYTRLATGRYLVKFTDKAGDTWLAGYGTPLHLSLSKTAPSTPAEYQGVDLTFSCDSEFGFLKLVE